MDINALDIKISEDLEAFKQFIQSEYPEGSRQAITSGDLAEFGKQTYYALNSLRENVMNFLREK